MEATTSLFVAAVPAASSQEVGGASDECGGVSVTYASREIARPWFECGCGDAGKSGRSWFPSCRLLLAVMLWHG
jgi:hypothetical protein